MRIISGNLGGRVFTSPAGTKTHPMAERVRGGIFNALGDITDLRVLDAFAGSGALGFEALSRGAASVLAIESDRAAQRTIAENARLLGLVSRHKLISGPVSAWLSTSAVPMEFDILFADPPYQDLQLETITQLVQYTKPEGVCILSWPGRNPAPAFPGMAIAKKKSYGDAQIVYYQPKDAG